jgi:NAD-dependent deacetylase
MTVILYLSWQKAYINRASGTLREKEKMLDRELKKEDRITIMSGAGISAESGVPTFRGEDGLWKGYDATQLANPQAFANDPDKVLEWYIWRRNLIGESQPNPAHYAIAELEKTGNDVVVITQNIDNLHRESGSTKIIELHGNIWKIRCSGNCSEIRDVPKDFDPPGDAPRECPNCGKLLRPHIVWFGEMLDPVDIRASEERLSNTDVLFIVGTSGVVQPAASLGYIAKSAGAFVVEVNLEATPLTGMADQSLFGPAGEILPKIFEHLLS